MKIKVLGYPVKIKFRTVKELSKKYGDTKDDNIYGYYSAVTREIEIAKDISRDSMKRILVHELQHALLGISGTTNRLNDDEEEANCDLSENWLEIFKDKTFKRLIK